MPGPNFTTSTITASPPAPLEGDVVTFTVTLRNSGDADARASQLTLTLPLEGMFVDLSGLETRVLDPSAKRAEASIDLPAGGARAFTFRVLAPRDSGGRVLIPRVALQHFHSNTSLYDNTMVTIGTRLGTDGVAVGGYRITTAGLITLALLVAIPVLWLIVKMAAPRARSSPAVAAVAIVTAIGFWTLFGAMALRDYQSLSWPETKCTILDRRLDVSESNSGGGSSSASQDDDSYAPMLAMRYAVNGVETYSTGFDTGSRLSVGGFSGAAADMRSWNVGSTVPCWYAPDDPTDIVVRRGFGGAYVFALMPVPVFLFGLWSLRRTIAR